MYGLVWCDMAGYGMTWHGLLLHGMTYDNVLCQAMKGEKSKILPLARRERARRND